MSLDIPIIDTHQHLWDLRRIDLPWLSGGGKLAARHDLEEYQTAATGLPIEQTVYMEVDVDPRQHAAEAEYVIGLCRRPETKVRGAVIGGRPGQAGFAAYIERFTGEPFVKGVRQVLHGDTPRGLCLEDTFVESVRLLGRHGLKFDLCMRPDDLDHAAALADLCPNTQFVLDHCGNAPMRTGDRSAWAASITELAGRDNVICKISGVAEGINSDGTPSDSLKPVINHCAEAFGINRIVFGSDWPVCTVASNYAHWVHALHTVTDDWSASDRRSLFHDNAIKFYQLTGSVGTS